MIINIIIIAFTLLIAYWWANQGVFSALLHLVSVIVAGAIAIGLWEKVTQDFLLRGGGFDSFAWGVSLIGIFAVSLFIIRLILDRLAPGNVDLPRWANLALGAPLGAAAGVITMGIVVIGCGMIQSSTKLAGFTGVARNGRNGQVEQLGTLWVPVHEWTEGFYAALSVNALSSRTPLRTHYPALADQAGSLMRDSYKGGRGQVTMPADGASVVEWNFIPGEPMAGVTLEFNSNSRDFGEVLTLSTAQIRLIERVSGKKTPRTSHPTQWFQNGVNYRYDDASHYMSSVPGQQTARATFVFQLPAGFNPNFVQVKGIRLELPESKRNETVVSAASSTSSSGDAPTPFGGRDICAVIEATNDIRPIRANRNQLRSINCDDNGYLTEGREVFPRGAAGRIDRNLLVLGIYETPGARIVQVDASRTSPAAISGDVRDRAADGARLMLVDQQGNRYPCIGYIYEDERIDLELQPKKNLDRLDDIKLPPSSGDQRLRLLFLVTEGAVLDAFMLGDVTIGRCAMEIPEARR